MSLDDARLPSLRDKLREAANRDKLREAAKVQKAEEKLVLEEELDEKSKKVVVKKIKDK